MHKFFTIIVIAIVCSMASPSPSPAHKKPPTVLQGLNGSMNGFIVNPERSDEEVFALNDSLQRQIESLHHQADSLSKEAKKLAQLYKKKAKVLADSLTLNGDSFFFKMDPFEDWDHQYYLPYNGPEPKRRTPKISPPTESQPFPAFPKWKIKFLHDNCNES